MRWIRRTSGLVTLLAGAGLTSVPLVVSGLQHSNVSTAPAPVEPDQAVQKGASALETTVKNDVQATWNYACLDTSADCPPPWTRTPTVAFNLVYNATSAATSYSKITSWKEYQYQYLTNVEKDFASLIHDRDTFEKYYLGPHNQNETDPERVAWNTIYDRLNPVIKEQYEADTLTQITDLLNKSVSLDFRITNAPSGDNLLAAGANQNYQQLLVAAITRDALLEAADAQNLVLDALYRGDTAPPALTKPLQDALNTKTNAALSDHQDVYDAIKTNVEAQFKLIDDAAKVLDTSEKRTAYENTVSLLKDARDGSLNGSMSGAISVALYSLLNEIDNADTFLGLNWTANETLTRLSADRLKALFAALSYAKTAVTDATTLATELYNYGDSIYKVNSISSANAYLPPSNRYDYYGPYAIALFITSLATATNLNGTLSAENPSLFDFFKQYRELADSGKFSEADLLQYLNVALTAFGRGLPISPALADLIAKADTTGQDAEAIKNALDKIKNEGLNSDTFAALLKQLNILADISGRVTGYVFIAVGGALALIAVGSSYTLLRGFGAKRKYGVSLAEYARSKNMLVAVAITAAGLAVALIVIAAAGVV